MIISLKVRPTPETSRLIRSREAARYLGMSEGELRDKARAGEIPVVQSANGGPWRFDVRDLDAWIERNKTREPLPAGSNGYDLRPGNSKPILVKKVG